MRPNLYPPINRVLFLFFSFLAIVDNNIFIISNQINDYLSFISSSSSSSSNQIDHCIIKVFRLTASGFGINGKYCFARFTNDDFSEIKKRMIDRLETESEVIFFAYCSPFSKQIIAGRWKRVDARSESKAIGPLQSFCTS